MQATLVGQVAGPGRGTLPSWRRTLAIMVGRFLLFASFQALIALVFLVGGKDAPWERSLAWWPLTAALTSVVYLGLLRWALRLEGRRFRDLLRVERASMGQDVLVVLGLVAAAAVVAMVPGNLLAAALWGDAGRGTELFVRPLPVWAAALSLIAFPLAIGLSELPTYFGYVLPRLARLSGRTWLAVAVSALFLSLQHVALPLAFDAAFATWRAFMFLPFALMLGSALAWRPRLLPYLVVVHVLLDLAAAAHVYAVSTS